MNELEVIKAKEIRGNIIEALYRNYGEDITISVLKNALPLSGFLKTSDIRNALYYLSGKQKEYVKVVVNTEDYMYSLVWLTPIGINLAEGDIKDVGVIYNV